MSFITAKELQEVVEGFVTSIWNKALGVKLDKSSFPHMTYREAMSSYGSDKPDVRFDMKVTFAIIIAISLTKPLRTDQEYQQLSLRCCRGGPGARLSRRQKGRGTDGWRFEEHAKGVRACR